VIRLSSSGRLFQTLGPAKKMHVLQTW